MSRSRGWVFTLNNFTEEDENRLVVPPTHVRYVCWGYEVGESGTPHLQGCLWTYNPVRMPTVKDYVGDRAHVEIARGQPSKAIAYCEKDGLFFEIGTRPQDSDGNKRAQKERYAKAWELARSGKLEDLVVEDPQLALQYWGTLKKIAAESQKMPESLAELDFHWWYGETGTGKSLTARQENPGAYIKLRNKWWDGYTNQQCVIIEEWGPDDARFLAGHLKQWCDHHPFTAEVKGGTIFIRPPKVIITSNWTMEECFLNPQDLIPLQRRFKVRHFAAEPEVDLNDASE